MRGIFGYYYKNSAIDPKDRWRGQKGYDQHICTDCGYTYADGFVDGLAINRAQLVTFLYRFAGAETVADASVLEPFEDAAKLPDFCRDAFAWAVYNGLIDGMDGALNASAAANRAQLATMLMRLDSMSK